MYVVYGAFRVPSIMSGRRRAASGKLVRNRDEMMFGRALRELRGTLAGSVRATAPDDMRTVRTYTL